MCLDPLLYKWISHQSPASAASPRHKAGRERTKSNKHQSLTRTQSATTPRKKSFARGMFYLLQLPDNYWAFLGFRLFQQSEDLLTATGELLFT